MNGNDKNIYKALMINLFYPAVLGSIVYTFIDIALPDIINSPPKGFLNGDIYQIIIKSFLILTTIIFYCFDYIYSSWAINYKPLYFYLDLGIISGIYLIIYFSNINSTSQPNLHYISFIFSLIFIAFFIWDYNEFKINNIKKIKAFYKKMVIWEVSSFIALGIYIVISVYCIKIKIINEVSLIMILILSTAYFGLLLNKNKKLSSS